ncbi:MAG: Gfo/Idh/MocA family oxidoreductase [Eubacteriales bacterium]|nr:Gfo/Idh/MocA family oxidoreductase [Eubacteriales bacterium]
MRIAIAGLGRIGDQHYCTYKTIKSSVPEISIDAVCDKDPLLLSKYTAQGIRAYTDYYEMLRCESSAIDMVDVCVPTFLHKDYSIKALDAGYAVVCEKPMALNEADCRLMADASQKNGKLLMIAHPMRFFKAYEVIKEYMDNNVLGALTSAFFNRCDGRPAQYDRWFYKDHLSGGINLDLLIHDVDAVQWLMDGLPDAVSAAAHRFIYPAVSGDDAIYDSISANLLYGNRYINLYCDWTVEMNMHMKRFFRVNFENGYLIYDESIAPVLTAMSDGICVKSIDLAGCDPYAEELIYFIKCLKNDEPVDRCPPENSLLSVRMCNMIRAGIITASS